jgi:hypothetical protein
MVEAVNFKNEDKFQKLVENAISSQTPDVASLIFLIYNHLSSMFLGHKHHKNGRADDH